MEDSQNPAPPRVSSRLSNSAKLSNSISRRVHREIRFGDYILGSTLGQGEFGKVKLGWRKDGKQPEQVAIKLIRKDTVPPKSNRETKVFREINALKILSHPNIVHLEQVIQNDKYIGIVLEYASGGELFDHILTHRYLKDSVACRLFAQLVSGVYYLHSKGIVHRDLKLENLLLDKHKNIIITDFGFANSFKASPDGAIFDLMSTSCGSPCYAAPELVVSDSKYVGQKVDVWSCGVILYAMLAGYLPFDDDPANPDGDNITQLYKYITTTPLTFPEYIQPMPRDLLRKILVPDPQHRIDLAAVRSHTWLSPHAHFLSVTPHEWDQSYLSSQNKPSATQASHHQQQQQGHLSRSQSVQVRPTGPNASSSATPRSTAGDNTMPRYNPYQQPQQPPAHAQGQSSHHRATSVAVPSTNAPSHSRRHSVQGGYTKGVSQPRSRIPDNRPTDEVVKSLDIPEYTTSRTPSSSTPSVTTPSEQFTPISRPQSNNNNEYPSPLPSPPISNASTDTTVGVQQSKNTRLPNARQKPRPTSFQPTSAGFSNFSTPELPPIETDNEPFRLPPSEPRVGLNHDSGMPGEMSRPGSHHSNSSTAALTKIGSDDVQPTVDESDEHEQQEEGEEKYHDSQTESAGNTVGTNNTAATSVTSTAAVAAATAAATSAAKPPPPKKTNTVNSITSGASVSKVQPSTTTKRGGHRRAAASISYGADKFFSRIMGGGNSTSSPSRNSVKSDRRYSMMPSTTNGSAYSETTTTSTEKKRFSLANSKPSVRTASGHHHHQKTTSSVVPSRNYDTVPSRRVTSPNATSSSSTQQRVSEKDSTPRKVPATKMSLQSDKSDGRPTSPDSQSAARKVVDFFKRRSRMV